MEDKNLQSAQDEQKKDDSKSIKGAKKQNARVFLWVICALYLLYLVSKLVKDLFGGLVETPGTRIVVIASSILFSVVAVYLLIISIRHAIRSFKANIDAMAEADAQERAEEAAQRLDTAQDEYDEDDEPAFDDADTDEEDDPDA